MFDRETQSYPKLNRSRVDGDYEFGGPLQRSSSRAGPSAAERPVGVGSGGVSFTSVTRMDIYI